MKAKEIYEQAKKNKFIGSTDEFEDYRKKTAIGIAKFGKEQQISYSNADVSRGLHILLG